MTAAAIAAAPTADALSRCESSIMSIAANKMTTQAAMTLGRENTRRIYQDKRPFVDLIPAFCCNA